MSDKYIKVNYTKPQEGEIKPNLSVFPMNYPDVSNLNTQSKWVMCKNKDKMRKDDYIFLGESSRMIYDSRSRMDHNLSDYVIGVYSKKKREMTFIDVESIFSVNQKVRRVEEHTEKVANKKLLEEMNNLNDKKPETTNTYVENKIQLIQDFGTQKAKKVANSIRSNIIQEENISSIKAAKRILEDNAMKQKQDVDLNEEEQKNKILANWRIRLPQFNLDTENVGEIFDLDSIVEAKFLETVEIDSIITSMKSDDFNQKKFSFCEYVFDHLKNFERNIKVKGHCSTPFRLKAYKFLDYMMKIKLLHAKIRAPPHVISQENNIDGEFVDFLLERFTETQYERDREYRIKTPANELKLIFHIIVLSLILGKYKINISLLSKSLKMDPKILQNYCRELGCKISEGKDKKKNSSSAVFVQLTAPLKLNLELSKYAEKK